IALVRAVGLQGRAEVAPLVTVDRPEVALGAAEARRLLGGSPLVPDPDARGLQRRHVRLTAQKPEELVDDRFEVELFRRDERKPSAQIEAHLVAEDAAGARARTVRAVLALLQDQLQEVQILAHDLRLPRSCARSKARWLVGSLAPFHRCSVA